MRELVPLTSSSSRARRSPTTSTSPSTRRRPTGSNCRSTSSRPCWPIRRSPAGTASASPSRPIRSAPGGDRLDRGAGRAPSTGELMVRLVKGAYWDTEVKRAQERGLDDYPVFTRKAMTDLHYVACAEQAAGGAAAHLPAIRHPQRADRRDRSSSGPAARTATSSSACTAWARRSTQRLLRGNPGARLPHLCAGRRPPRPARLSRPPPSRKRRQLLLRRRSRPIPTCRSRRC